MRRAWWVNQGITSDEESRGGFLWSPKVQRNGARSNSYESMTQIQVGDLILGYWSGALRAIGVATATAITARVPDSFGDKAKYWNQEGWRVAIRFSLMEDPVTIAENIRVLSPLIPEKYSPFRRNGKVNQDYLFPLPEPLASAIQGLLSPRDLSKIQAMNDSSLADKVTPRSTKSPLNGETISRDRVDKGGVGVLIDYANFAQDTKTETIHLADLHKAQDRNSTHEKFISLPRFQRGLVWGENQKQELIESLFNGFPVGAILGFATGELFEVGGRTRQPVELIDGLQRTTTIIQFLNRPLVYAPIRTMFSREHLVAVCDALGVEPDPDSAIQVLEDAVVNWARRCEVKERTKGFKESELAKVLLTSGVIDIPFDPALPGIIDPLLSPLLEEIEKGVEVIEKATLPLIVYMGNRDNVPTIFERVNSQGIKLSKYERFAAQWIHSRVDVSNKKILEFVQAKYAQLMDEGYVVEDLGDSVALGAADITLFEYLFGLGKILSERFTHLFTESSTPDDSPAVGFVLATVAHRLPISKMNQLDAKLGATGSKAVSLKAFEEALLEACGDVEKRLLAFLRINLNKQGSKVRFLPHSQNQINSMVLRYLVEVFDTDTWAKKKKHEGAALLKNFPAHYLQDVLLQRWSGSGDSRLYEMVWDDEGRAGLSKHYLESIDADQMRQTLETWHEDQLRKKQKTRGAVGPEAKTFLKFLYSSIVSVSDDQSEVFDLEHLYPVAKLVDRIERDDSDEGWPMSAVGNLCILPASLNRIKGETMLGDYLNSLESEKNPDELKKIQEWVISPLLDDLKLSDELDKEHFQRFCRARMEPMISRLVVSICS